MNAHATFALPGAVRELRLLTGARRGATFRIDADGRYSVGHRLDNDIVLRGRATRDLRLTLATGAGGIVEVGVIAGEARLLGTLVAAGTTVQLPDFVPLFAGDLAFAVGPQDHHRWLEAEALALAPVPASPDAPSPGPGSAPVPLRRQVEALRGLAGGHVARIGPVLPELRAGRWLIAGAAMLLLLAVLIEPMGRWVSAGLAGPQAAQAAVADAGLTGVTVRALPTGALLYAGQVRDETALVTLRRIAARFGPSQIQVTSAAQLAEAAADSLRSQGVDAEVRAAGMGSVVVESEYLPRDRQIELTERLRADIAGLNRVDFRLVGSRGQQDLRYFFAAGSYGLATFVDGDPGYIATADGSVWFEGAVLPTGHELVQAGGGLLRFRRNGIDEVLTMGAPVEAAGRAPDGPAPVAETPAAGRLAMGSGV